MQNNFECGRMERNSYILKTEVFSLLFDLDGKWKEDKDKVSGGLIE